MFVCLFVCVCKCVCLFVCLFVCFYLCLFVCLFVCVCVHYNYFYYILQQLAEEHSISERNAQERDEAEHRARQAETKSLSLSRELEELREKVDETDRLRKSLQSERDALMESKDDVGKNVRITIK